MDVQSFLLSLLITLFLGFFIVIVLWAISKHAAKRDWLEHNKKKEV